MEGATDNKTEELVAAIRRGEGGAFAVFYHGYADSILKYLTRIVGSREDAEEITQDAFAYIWENRETLSVHTSLKGFLIGMAKNMALKHIRHQSYMSGMYDDMRCGSMELTDLTDEGFITEETSLLIRHAVRRMPEQRRKVFLLSREEGLTYNEIARHLNLSPNTVRNHLSMALEDIRDVLAAFFALSLLN